MPRHNSFGLELIDTPHSGFEIVDLKPEQHPIAIRLIVLIPNGTVVMINIKPIQLLDAPIDQRSAGQPSRMELLA